MNLRKIILTILVFVVAYCNGQKEMEVKIVKCQLLSIEIVSEPIYLLKAIDSESNDSINILVDVMSYMNNSLVFSNFEKNTCCIIEMSLLNDLDLAQLFSIRKTEFCIYINDKEIISSDNDYYYFTTLIK